MPPYFPIFPLGRFEHHAAAPPQAASHRFSVGDLCHDEAPVVSRMSSLVFALQVSCLSLHLCGHIVCQMLDWFPGACLGRTASSTSAAIVASSRSSIAVAAADWRCEGSALNCDRVPLRLSGGHLVFTSESFASYIWSGPGSDRSGIREVGPIALSHQISTARRVAISTASTSMPSTVLRPAP